MTTVASTGSGTSGTSGTSATSASSVTRTLVVAAVVWLGLHVVLAALYVEDVGVLPLYLLGLVVLLAGSALALHPLLRPTAPPELPWVPLALTVAIPLAQALNLAGLRPGVANSYANWANGAAAVMLTGLVLRRHTGLATLAGAASVALMAAAYLAQEPSGSALAAIFLLSVPAQMWVLGPYGVRTVVTRAERVATDLNARAATEAAAGPVHNDWEQVRGQRLRELEQQVLPFLAHVSDAVLVGSAERAQAGALARMLRDTLLARQLLDGPVQAALAAARSRGVRVSLGTDAAGPLTTGLRSLLPDLLALPGLTALAVRVAGTPQLATLVVQGEVRGREVAVLLRPLADIADVERARTERGLVVSIHAREG